MSERTDADVCVIGGGPAGSTLAARLAGLGHDVVVLERDAFPRPHVGEGLTPAIWPLLTLLGIEDAGAAGLHPSTPALVRWDGGVTREIPTSGPAPGGTVDRSAFDALLLKTARGSGARVRQPAAATRLCRRGGGWEIAVVEGGRRRVLRTRFVADASGRARLLGGRRERTAARTIALYAKWPRWHPGSAPTRVAANSGGWVWAARLPNAMVSVMAFVDPELLRGTRREVLYLDMLAEAGLLEELRGPPGCVAVCDATPYRDEAPIDAVSVKVGEAAFAIDPLSSAGVQAAMQSAVAASAAVHTLLSGGDAGAAIDYYTAHSQHTVEQHSSWTAGYYAEHRPHQEESFWRARAGSVPEPPLRTHSARLSDLWDRPVRLTDGAVVAPVACVVADRVEMRAALAHPSLPRPVAFLGDIELAALLSELDTAPTLRSAILEWGRRLSLEKAVRVGEWLAVHGLLAEGKSAPTVIT